MGPKMRGEASESPAEKEIGGDAAWVGERSHPPLTPGAAFGSGEVPGPGQPGKTRCGRAY